jgi:hypothetical protein
MPVDAEQAARQRAGQAEYERRSEALRQRAQQAPGGGGRAAGGWRGGGPAPAPTFAVKPDETFDGGGTARGAIHTQEQEERIRQKAGSGQFISNEDL